MKPLFGRLRRTGAIWHRLRIVDGGQLFFVCGNQLALDLSEQSDSAPASSALCRSCAEASR